MQRIFLYVFTCICIFVYLDIATAQSAVERKMLDPGFSATDKPEGPTPKEHARYKAFTFSLTNLPSVANNDYIRMRAELSDVTKHKGVCANWTPDKPKLPRKEDMFFHRDDYPAQAGGWKYDGWNSLSFKLDSDDKDRRMPGEIKVRCYDWGGYAMLTFTFQKKTGDDTWATYTDTHSIPFDENENQIADGWETEASLKVVLPNGKLGYDPGADGETIAVLLGKNYLDTYPGDGWTIADEYRGLFKESTDGDITRLDPMKKEVIVSPEDTNDANDMWSYGTGSYDVPEHELVTVHPNLVKRAFDNPNGLFGIVWMKKDIGWVNFNSEQKRVYAIRIKRADIHADGIDVAGESPTRGPPAPDSRVLIFYEGIGKFITKNIKLQKGSTKWHAAVDVVVGTAISHEIGHNVNCDHCGVQGCLMLQSANPNDYYTWNGKTLTSKRTGFKAHTGQKHVYAVTGAPVVKGGKSYIRIEIEAEANNEENEEDTGGTPTPENTDTTPALSYTLTSSDGSYTATAGTGHEANFTTNQAYSSVYWYVRSPSESSGLGTNVKTDTGDSSTTKTAQLGYSFPSGVAGDYVITAYVYPPAGAVSIKRVIPSLSLYHFRPFSLCLLRGIVLERRLQQL